MASASLPSFLELIAIGRDEAGHHDADAMPELLELSTPLMGAAAGFHADEARWECGDEFQELVAADGLAQDDAAAGVDAVQREDGLCEIEANGSNLIHDFPSGFRLIIDTSILAPRCRCRDGEVPIIR
jgi:hypothetical protein